MKSLRKIFAGAGPAALVSLALLVAPLCAPWCASGSCSAEKADRIATSRAGHCGSAMGMREHESASRWTAAKSCLITEAPAVVRGEEAGQQVPSASRVAVMANSFGSQAAQGQVEIERSRQDAVNSPPVACPSSVILRI